MVEHAVAEEGARLGLSPLDLSAQDLTPDPALQAAWDEVRRSVGRFWAPPSDDPSTPPPHSTGAAVDLTLANLQGQPLEMGGAIDAIGAVSEPNFYAEAARTGADLQAAQFHDRRTLLARVLESQGFRRHPNEWWHFSFGDQLGLRTGHHQALGGRCDPALSDPGRLNVEQFGDSLVAELVHVIAKAPSPTRFFPANEQRFERGLQLIERHFL